MATYLVTWQIDVDNESTDTPEKAAKRALAAIRRRGSIAHVFETKNVETGEVVEVDLNFGRTVYRLGTKLRTTVRNRRNSRNN